MGTMVEKKNNNKSRPNSSLLWCFSHLVFIQITDTAIALQNNRKVILFLLYQTYFFQGITQEHLDMLGPLICHTIRPLVFKAGLWSIEVEKSWTHLFDMVI